VSSLNSQGSHALLAELVGLSRWLAVPERRLQAARGLAQRLGADDLLLFTHDPEIEGVLPAPGFARTLPDGRSWRAFLSAVQTHGTYHGELAVPSDGSQQSVLGVAADDGTLVVLLGGAPLPEEVLVLRPLLPMLAAALRGEVATRSATAQAVLAEQSNAEAEALALSLDRARARLEALAHENGRLYREAQEAVRARDQFLSIASHELRTPLTGMKSGVQILRRMHDRGEGSSPRAEQVLQRVEIAVDRLSELTQDLLDVASLRLGRLPLHLQSVDLVHLAKHVAGERREYLDARYTLEVSVVAPTPMVLGDPTRLEQVAANVLDNAIKYSPAGGNISVLLEPHDGGALLHVRDSGIGVPIGCVETIFEPFGRAPNAQRQHVPGMGLGLFLCRQIVEQHAGRVWVESPGENCGTTVNVWLPAAREKCV